MSEDALQVIAQCQRCGRGFLSLGKDCNTDNYAHPQAYKRGDTRPCGGDIKLLVDAVAINEFRNYGPILPTQLPMTGIWSSLNREQQEKVLAYDSNDTLGTAAIRRGA